MSGSLRPGVSPRKYQLVRLVYTEGMARVYSTYEAKAKLSEILKKVRAGQRVGISYRGVLVAEVAPVTPARETLAQRLKRLEAQGVIVPAKRPGKPFPRIERRPGALKRFLASRD